MAAKRVALIVGSTREPRVGLFLHKYVNEQLAKLDHTKITLETVDLAKQQLPLFNEPVPPIIIPKDQLPDAYTTPQVREWSRLINSFDGYIFLTSEHNSSVPASLKSAIDYLYHEMVEKPAAIVSYGGGGGKGSAGHLGDILSRAYKMPVVEHKVHILPGHTLLQEALDAGGKVPDGKVAEFKEKGVEDDIGKLWTGLREKLEV